MEATEKNEETVKKIVNLLSELNYTVREAGDVLSYANRLISAKSTVQKVENV